MSIQKKHLDVVNQFVDELIELNKSNLKTQQDKQEFLEYIKKNFDSLFTKYINSKMGFVERVREDKTLSNRILDAVYDNSFKNC